MIIQKLGEKTSRDLAMDETSIIKILLIKFDEKSFKSHVQDSLRKEATELLFSSTILHS